MKKLVIALGGNALGSTPYEQLRLVTETAKPIVDDLISYGYVKGRVRLGITYYPISDVTGAMTGYTPGLLISEIDQTEDSYKKGLRAGDTITKIDSVNVRSAEDVEKALDGKVPGDTVKLSVFRKSVTGKTSQFTIDVILGEDKGYSQIQ